MEGNLKEKSKPKKAKRYSETLDYLLLTKKEAKFYIDYRDRDVEFILDSYKEEYKDNKNMVADIRNRMARNRIKTE